MREYHDLYFNLDVILLADIFENLRKTCIIDYDLDPCDYYTLPGFTFDACLKFTDQELDLFTNNEKKMFLFIENAIRGGISVVSHRRAKANNPLVPDFDLNFHTPSSLSMMPTTCMVGQCQSDSLPQSSHFERRKCKILWPWRYNEIGRLQLYTRSRPPISGTPSRRTPRLLSRCCKNY